MKREFAPENLVAVVVAGGQCPGKELFDDGFAACATLDLIANLLVDPGYGDEYCRLDGGEGCGKAVKVTAIGKGRAVAEECIVQVAGSDVGER